MRINALPDERCRRTIKNASGSLFVKIVYAVNVEIAYLCSVKNKEIQKSS